MKKAMLSELFLERLTDGKPTDTLKLKIEIEKNIQNMELLLPYTIEEEKREIRFSNDFNSDTITKYNYGNNNQYIINQATGSCINELNENIEIKENEIVKLIEFVNETKIINGYNCFKVIYNYKEPQVSDFDFCRLFQLI